MNRSVAQIVGIDQQWRRKTLVDDAKKCIFKSAWEADLFTILLHVWLARNRSSFGSRTQVPDQKIKSALPMMADTKNSFQGELK